ncbi:pseudouridylate synthase 7 homolog [Clytia hemisphaerica]|eukprot:TCONS_00059598-protein
MSTQAMKHKIEEENEVQTGNDENKTPNNGEQEPSAKKAKLENEGTKQINTAESSVVENIEAESKVGMKMLINKYRFQGIIKQRFSDFMVREIDLDGNKTFLTDTNHVDDQKPATESNKGEPKEMKDTTCPIDDVTLVKRIDDFAKNESEETLDDRITFLNNDKENRKACHMYFKTKYQNLETDVINKENDTREFVIYYKKSKKGDPRARKNRNTEGQFCHFVLHKQNKDTMDTINLLSKKLRITSKLFSYAGTKDRRATTIQRVAVKQCRSKRLKELNKILINIVLGNFQYKSEPLKLGDLSGNEFTLIIRDVTNATENQIMDACRSLQENGFVNYFGLQRFGTGGAGTHEIGRALLKDDFEKACNLILAEPSENDNDRSKERNALKIYSNNKDPQKAFQALRNRNGIEGKLLSCLKNSPKDFLGALGRLPRNTRLLYLHSYQSFIWNNAVSYRLEKFGFKPVVGDLVLTSETDEEGHKKARLLTEDDIASNTFTIEDIVLPMPGYDVIYPNNSCYDYMKSLMEKDGLDITNMRRAQKDNSLSGAYRTFLVKPKNMTWELMRYDDFTISLIENDVDKMKKSEEEEKTKTKNENECKKESGEEIGENMKAKSSGDSETIKIGSGVDFAVGADDGNKIIISDDENEAKNSTETKITEIESSVNSVNSEPDKSGKSESAMETDSKTEADINDKDSKTLGVSDGKYLALKLIFQLPSSCYATTALRELLTSDSSFKAQQQLNANFNKKKM